MPRKHKDQTHSSLFLERLYSDKIPALLFDGATGTSFQDLGLTAEDFGGDELEGCNEYLVKTCPAAVEKVHSMFIESGCDVIETNTFGASSIVLAEYGIENEAYELNKLAAMIAKKTAQKYTSKSKPIFVAGSIGPTTKLPTLGHISFDELLESYKIQAEGLLDGGVDLIIIETCQDVLQIKAAVQAVSLVSNNKNIFKPIMVSITIEATGTMLLGTDIAAALTILEPLDIDILGLNCATGPEQMKEHIKFLSDNSPFIISCIPNAGLPENVGGVAHYKLTPVELKMQLMHFVQDLGVRVIGGCCGTNTKHIKALSDLINEISKSNYDIKKPTKRINPCASSIYSVTPYHQDNSFLIVGEQLNASGSKKVRDLLNKEDWDGMVSIAREQERENAHILDVNVDYVGRDGVKDMKEIVSRLVTNVNIPLMLDSTEWEKMESGLKVGGGKYILNSTNYEDGNDRFFRVLKLAKQFGAAIVIGTIDEEGMARTADKKFEIALRGYKDALNYGIPAHEIFYDPLALPISTGIEEDRKNAVETIKAIKLISQELREVHLILGISNISFGLSPAARISLNSVFLHECISSGLDSAIVSPSKIIPLSKISFDNKNICLDLIKDNRRFKEGNCIYDPLTKITKIFEGVSTQQARSSIKDLNKLTVEEALKNHIIEGEKINLQQQLDKALKKYSPLEIINNYLLDGMKVVGELFGSGQMQLPFVLQSAETMKFAVSYLEDFMDKEDEDISKGKILIATVKGDVHDIGKNLVDIILTNNGYDVINLGIKQDISLIIEAQKRHQADCIAMSGLLVKSTAFMKDNLEKFNESNITVPVILGGAALTPKFVNDDCNDVYNGQVIYGKDAFTDLRFMDLYMLEKRSNRWSDNKGFDTEKNNQLFNINLINNKLNSLHINNQEVNQKDLLTIDQKTVERSPYISIEPAVKVPFIGTRIIDYNDISIEKLLLYLDKRALFSGQWQFRKIKNQSNNDYKQFLEDKAQPILDLWIERIISDDLLSPQAVYGYFNCGRQGNELNLFSKDSSSIIGKFLFPRQKRGKLYCISDYFLELNNNKPIDYIPMQAVTMGHKASEFANELFKSDSYSEYLYFHGLAVQMAEAFAEWLHSRIRIECGFDKEEPNNNSDILLQKYRGCRFSFGYPACPNVGDSKIQLDLLGAEKIDLSIDNSDQLHPEQSTTALVALHSQAKYFGI